MKPQSVVVRSRDGKQQMSQEDEKKWRRTTTELTEIVASLVEKLAPYQFYTAFSQVRGKQGKKLKKERILCGCLRGA